MRELIFHCLNQDCESKVEKLRTFKTSTGTVSKFVADDTICVSREDGDDSPEICQYCEREMKLGGRTGVTVFLGTSLMSKEQKKEMLVKRSMKHEMTGERKDARAQIMENNIKQYGK